MKVVPIATKHSSGDSWSPQQLLEEFVADVQAGRRKPVKLVLHYFEENERGDLVPHRWQAGCSRAEEIALIELVKAEAIEDWKA